MTSEAQSSVRASRRPATHHGLYLGAAIAAAIAAFAGFARVYYLRPLFHLPPLTPLLHLHGAVMTAWFGLFILQVLLIASGHVALHRRIGIFGSVLAVFLVIVTGLVTVNAAIRDARDPTSDSIFFLGFNAFVLALYVGFFAGGVLYRRRGDFHKRLMLLAALSLLPPAFGRMPLAIMHSGMNALLALDALVLACVGVDVLRSRHLHPVFAWGAPVLIASLFVALFAAGSPAWMSFASRLLAQ
ncbi:MAG: hypothetical protein ABUS48_00270 [Pseudomonadota bacterium]